VNRSLSRLFCSPFGLQTSSLPQPPHSPQSSPPLRSGCGLRRGSVRSSHPATIDNNRNTVVFRLAVCALYENRPDKYKFACAHKCRETGLTPVSCAGNGAKNPALREDEECRKDSTLRPSWLHRVYCKYAASTPRALVLYRCIF
jgi:hypothetical protein